MRYILSGPETRLYRKLESDRERRAFIKQFWLRRDPNVNSMENEFRFDYWSRVAEANHLFTRTTVPGWKTDRGRFYIMLGPPDEVDADTMPGQRPGQIFVAPTSEGRNEVVMFGGNRPGETFHGLERWIYRNRPGDRLPPNFILAFRQGPGGDYELSDDSRDWTMFQNMLSEVVRPVFITEAGGISTDPDPDSPLITLYQDVAVALDLGQLTRAPAPDELLGELVTSEEFFGRIPFLLQTDYYKTAGENTLAVFTVGVEAGAFSPGPPPAAKDLMVAGRLESIEDPDRFLLLAGDNALVPAPAETGGDLLLYQVVRTIPPGAYNASFGIVDSSRENIGSYRERVSIPRFPESGLTLSSLSLARELQPAPDVDPAAPVAAPFRLGNYQVVPLTGAVLRNGEEFALYYQIYGAAVEPSSGRPSLTVSYRFFVLREDGFRAIGAPVVYKRRDQSVQGWSFPLINWPEATFRLEVTVEDDLSGQVAVGQTVFSISGSIPS